MFDTITHKLRIKIVYNTDLSGLDEKRRDIKWKGHKVRTQSDRINRHEYKNDKLKVWEYIFIISVVAKGLQMLIET